MEPKDIQHLYWRAGFGILPKRLQSLKKKSKKSLVQDLFKPSSAYRPLKIDTAEIETILESSPPLSDANRKKVQVESRKKTLELNQAWINRLATSEDVLREKMTLFWANIFVCKDNNVVYIQQFNNTLRKHALGNFKDFVNAISKEAAMTKYLNTKQNRKQKPNENFARELMELFTLGEGHYTEDDIKESARAFTGYSHNLSGAFVMRRFQHDNNPKTFFGKTGNFSGEDIIDIILDQKQCAQYISEKIYKYFVNNTVNKAHVNAMAEVFYKDYDIANLMRFVFNSSWFYAIENRGVKIKSPVELIVGLKKLVPLDFKNSRQLIYLQRQLGQILLDPPNVAGWKGGKNWIDSNTIVLRLKLPSILLNEAYISVAASGKEDAMMATKKANFTKRQGRRMTVESHWDVFNNNFERVPMASLSNHLIAGQLSDQTLQFIDGLEKVSKKEFSIQLMSLPEYQMC